MEPPAAGSKRPPLSTVPSKDDGTTETSSALSTRNPQARFSKLSEKLRQVTPDDLQCSVFCGGKKCKYETSTQWEPKDMAIDGLFSHWVTDEILACARPNSNSIEKYDIIDQFARFNIKSIINLQSRGEHSKCGPTLHDSGFSYDPQAFMQKNIYFYNYSIKDYGVASRDFVLDMVKVVAFALTEGKVAIHCHAGLGRTGVLIACYLVYALRVQANDAIRYIRIKRPNSIQTRNQILCVQNFAKYISPSFVIFTEREDAVGLLEHLQRQKRILHGYESRNLKYTPKLVYTVCERLLLVCKCCEDATSVAGNRGRRLVDIHGGQSPFWKTYLAANTVDGDSYNSSVDSGKSVQDDMSMGALSKMVAATMGKSSPSPPPHTKRLLTTRQHLRRGSSSPALMQALYINCADSDGRSTSSAKTATDSGQSSFSSDISPYGSWDQESVLSDGGSLLDVPLDDDCASTVKQLPPPVALTTTNDVTHNACFGELNSQIELRKELAKMDESDTTAAPVLPAEDLAAMLIGLGSPHSFDNCLNKKCRLYQEELNSKALAWNCLSHEMDPRILLALLISWFHTLQKPVLNADELAKLMPSDKDESIADVIGRFSTMCRFVVEYLVRFVHRLRPLSEVTRNKLVERVADLLLQCNDDCAIWTSDQQKVTAVVGIMRRLLQQIGSGGGSKVLAESPVSR